MNRTTSIHLSIRLLMLVFLIGSGLTFTPAYSAEPVRIGVLAYRPKAQTLAQWQPLATALKQALPEHDFVVQAFTFHELDEAVAGRQVDFVLTNPGHYIVLVKRSGLSAPLATLAVNNHDRSCTLFGGVIFTRSNQTHIDTLGDIKGKKVATASIDSLGGYQMQAYELRQAGVKLPQDANLVITDMPQDNVVDAVLSGQADVGFVRSGVLENMVQEGKLDRTRIKILNLQQWPDFPVQVSTRLYPEWSFAALPGIDEKLARQVVATLFMLEKDTATMRAMKIHGFAVPADYMPIVELLKTLRLPPFDATPAFELSDLWHKYRIWIVTIILLVFLLMGAGGILIVQIRKVRQGRQRFATLFEHSPEPLLIIANRQFIDCNMAALNVLGISDNRTVLGINFADISPERQPDGEYSKPKAERLFRSVESGEIQCFEWVYLKNKGEALTCSVRLVPTLLDNQTVILCSWHDITERKQVEAELTRSNAELEQFAYAVSHDMRQPLRMVTSYLSIIESALAGKLDEETRQCLEFALNGAKRMDAMILSLLDYSRIGRVFEGKVRLSSKTALDEALAFLGPEISASRGEIKVSGEWPDLVASRDELTRLLQNLIGNAVKYHLENQPPQVEVQAAVRGSVLRVEVRDHGIGIEPSQMNRLFKVFSRLQAHSRFDGTGVGLALCRKIVEHHGGTIGVESAGEDQGCVFWIELPLAIANS